MPPTFKKKKKVTLSTYHHVKFLSCCASRPAFGCCVHPNTGKNTFFWEISLFCTFSDVFCWFKMWNHRKRFKMNKKGWKRLKKSVSTSFQVCTAPKSWSKYTTLSLTLSTSQAAKHKPATHFCIQPHYSFLSLFSFNFQQKPNNIWSLSLICNLRETN